MIGAGAKILDNIIEIGACPLIAAGAVVLQLVPPGAVGCAEQRRTPVQ
jgi:serine acetyltransferase